MATNYLVENNVIMSTATPAPVAGVDSYEALFGISINGNNGLYLQFWAHKNGQLVINDLGTAEYQIYDADNNALVPFTEDGLTATAFGVFRATPINAIDLIDLTHYLIRVSIYVDGELIESIWPFNLGE